MVVGTSISSILLAIESTWVKEPMGYPFNWEDTLPMDSVAGPTHVNTIENSITITGSYSYMFYDQVQGSSASNPPWTSNYSTLYNNSASVTRNYSKSLPSGYSGDVLDKWFNTIGSETWVQGSDVRTRDRVRYTVTKLMYLHKWPTGSGGGGG